MQVEPCVYPSAPCFFTLSLSPGLGTSSGASHDLSGEFQVTTSCVTSSRTFPNDSITALEKLPQRVLCAPWCLLCPALRGLPCSIVTGCPRTPSLGSVRCEGAELVLTLFFQLSVGQAHCTCSSVAEREECRQLKRLLFLQLICK